MTALGATWRRWLGRLFPRPGPPPPRPPATAPGGPADPETFVPSLNAIRKDHGLGPVIGDAGLVDWARRNNEAQRDEGIGHHVIPPGCRQNCAMGYPDVPALLSGWMASPGHRANLLEPSITRVGLHHLGPWWTYNAI